MATVRVANYRWGDCSDPALHSTKCATLFSVHDLTPFKSLAWAYQPHYYPLIILERRQDLNNPPTSIGGIPFPECVVFWKAGSEQSTNFRWWDLELSSHDFL